MTELERAANTFSDKAALGLKNIRFFIAAGEDLSPEKLAAEINRMDDAFAAGKSVLVDDLDKGLVQKDIRAIIAEVEHN